MTTHLDDELLAQWALSGEPLAAEAADHLQGCARCRDSLSELRAVAALSHDLPRLEQPSAGLWEQVSAELGLSQPRDPLAPGAADSDRRPPATDNDVVGREADDRTVAPVTGLPAARPAAVPAARRRRGIVLVAAGVAAVVGIGVGIGIGVRVSDNDSNPATTEAMIRLEPLTGKSGDGTADLLQSADGSLLQVAASGLDSGQGFYEVWLINADGKRMVSLGVLNPRTGGTFQIPPDLTDQGYRIVDVSLEPDDGNPEHSGDSIIRGTLPA